MSWVDHPRPLLVALIVTLVVLAVVTGRLLLVEPRAPSSPVAGVQCDVVLADAEYTTVNTAVTNAATGTRTVICLPEDAATWSNTVVIPDTKPLWIIGSGIGRTVITMTTSTPGNRRAFEIFVTASAATFTRIAGMTIDHALMSFAGGCGTFCSPIAIMGDGKDAFRIDHMRLQNLGDSAAGVAVIASDTGNEYANGSELSGLIDNNEFSCQDDINTSCHSTAFQASPPFDTNLATSVAAGWGAPFSRPIDLGGDSAVYIEDNDFQLDGFYRDGPMDTFGGARIVFRFNRVRGSACGGHGADSAAYRGHLLIECFRNSFELGSTTGYNCSFNRGAVMFIFDNTCTHPSSPPGFALSTYRSRPETFADLGQCDGSSSLDMNSGSGTNTRVNYPSIGTGQNPGWPCLDQVGWFFDENAGSGAVNVPSLIFNNNGGNSLSVTNYEPDAGNMQNYIKCNQDYYLGNDSFTGSLTVGNCATGGIGRGTLASRPSTCTTGVYWWATDQGSWNAAGVNGYMDSADTDGVLYRCTATNTWTVYYTPRTYPHPLRAQ